MFGGVGGHGGGQHCVGGHTTFVFWLHDVVAVCVVPHKHAHMSMHLCRVFGTSMHFQTFSPSCRVDTVFCFVACTFDIGPCVSVRGHRRLCGRGEHTHMLGSPNPANATFLEKNMLGLPNQAKAKAAFAQKTCWDYRTQPRPFPLKRHMLGLPDPAKAIPAEKTHVGITKPRQGHFR